MTIDQRDPIMQFFDPTEDTESESALHQESLQRVSELAGWIYDNFPRNPERTVTLRKLLEARDAMSRTLKAGSTTPPWRG